MPRPDDQPQPGPRAQPRAQPRELRPDNPAVTRKPPQRKKTKLRGRIPPPLRRRMEAGPEEKRAMPPSPWPPKRPAPDDE